MAENFRVGSLQGVY